MHRAILNAYLEQNRLIVLSAVVVQCCLFSPLFLLLLLYPFYQAFFSRKKLEAQPARKLRAIHQIPWQVRLRHSQLDDSYLVSGFGISALMVTPDVLGNPESSAVRNKLLHELGHHGRADYLACLSVTGGVIFVSFVMVTVLILHWTGSAPLGHSALPVLTCLLLIAGLCTWRMRTNFHTREYLADTSAMESDAESYRKYLERLVRSAPFRRSASRLGASLQRVTHPSSAQRLMFQDNPLEAVGMPKLRSLAVNLGAALVASALGFIDLPRTLRA